MKKRLLSLACAVLTALAIALPALAEEKNDLSVELKAHKVVHDKKGKETMESADKAKPGDVIEYVAAYRNAGKKKMANLNAVVPVPSGTEFIPGSAVPSKIAASLDGKEYQPVPLKRKIRLANGAEEMRDVPATEYRFVRWDLKTLDPGKSTTVRIRVKVLTGGVEQPPAK